jgi:ABC-type Fe3+-hydroxamate transport system substrate-binding protein
MKQIGVVLLLVVLLAACSQQTPLATLDSQASQWKLLGGRLNTENAGDSDLALRANDRPVVTFIEANTVVVKEWNGSRWVSLGQVENTTGFNARPTIATRAKNAWGASFYDPIGVTWQKYSNETTQNDIYVRLRVGNTWLSLGGPIDVIPTPNKRLK